MAISSAVAKFESVDELQKVVKDCNFRKVSDIDEDVEQRAAAVEHHCHNDRR